MRTTPKSFVLGNLILICLIPLFLCSHEVAIIAHRGNSSEAPENTLPAFRSAAEIGVSFLECDVHLSKEEIPVIIHDHLLFRTTDNPNPIAIDDLSLEQIKALDVGLWFHESFRGQEVLTLSELLDSPLNEANLMLEVKEGSAPEARLAEAVVDDLLRHSEKPPNRNIIVGSLSPEVLKHVKELAPRQPTIAIIGNIENIHQYPDPDIYALNNNVISEALIKEIHQEGKKVWIWTVDEPEEMIRLINMDVDGIITNKPRLLKELLQGVHRSLLLFLDKS